MTTATPEDVLVFKEMGTPTMAEEAKATPRTVEDILAEITAAVQAGDLEKGTNLSLELAKIKQASDIEARKAKREQAEAEEKRAAEFTKAGHDKVKVKLQHLPEVKALEKSGLTNINAFVHEDGSYEVKAYFAQPDTKALEEAVIRFIGENPEVQAALQVVPKFRWEREGNAVTFAKRVSTPGARGPRTTSEFTDGEYVHYDRKMNVTARMQASGGKFIVDGKEFDSPSGAAQSITGYPTNGNKFWTPVQS